MAAPKTIEIIHTWTDDHILCCTVKIDGDEERELWWLGWQNLAALTYYNDSPSARQIILDHKVLDTYRLINMDG